MRHDSNTLRRLLEELAQLPVPGKLSQQDVALLSESFRDCRLELIRLRSVALSVDQSHRLEQMDYRLQMVASGQALAESIPSAAQETLETFGWT
jgi:hypothetical protein